MFIYHFNRLIRSRLLWGFFAIIIAVAFVAVDSCFRTPQDMKAAGTLNGKKVSANQFEQVVQAIRGFGRNRDTETSSSVVDRRAWEQIAARVTAEKDGMASSKEEVRAMIREERGFQGANGFDMNRYRMLLADLNLTPALYESIISHQLALMKSASLIESAAWISPMEMDDELAALTDRFTVQVASVSNRFANAEMPLTDKDYRKFYEEHKESFALADRMSVRYIAFSVTNYIPFVSVPEEDLQEYYDSHTETYSRTTSSNTTETIPFAEVRGKILSELQMEEARYCASTAITFNIYGKLANAGSNALALAAEQAKLTVKTSPLFSADDTPFWVENGKEFVGASFELDPDRSDARYGIVKGDNFVYVMEPLDRSPAHTPAYEQVLEDLRPQALAKARSEAFQDYAKKLRVDMKKLVDEGKSFSDAAKAQSLNVSTSITYTVSDIQNQKFDNSFSIAYGAMQLKKGELSEAVPASAAQSLIIYVKDRQPGDALSAEMMRSQIRTSLARRHKGNLFSEWLAWNLKQQAFVPRRPLQDDDEEAGIQSAEDEEPAPKKKTADQ